MNRYNLGFMKFGPLEQCDDGELIKYSDYIEDVEKLSDQHQKEIDYWYDIYCKYRDEAWESSDKLFDQKLENIDSKVLNCVLGAIVFVETATLLIINFY